MNWKEEAVDKLKKYRLMVNAVQSIPQELERLTMESLLLQSGTGRLGGTNQRSQEDRLMNNLVRRGALEHQYSCAENWLSVTDRAMALLTDQERQTLTGLYIDGLEATAVCRGMGMERSNLYRHRDEALRKLTLALYGALES